MDAVILASGFGKRLGSITNKLPKTLLKINNKTTILERLINQFKSSKINKIFILSGKHGEKITKIIANLKLNDIFIIKAKDFEKGPIYTFNNAEPLRIKEDFLLCVSDTVFQNDFLGKFLSYHQKNTFSMAYSKKKELQATNILFIQDPTSVSKPKALGFNSLVVNKPNIKVTPFPLMVLNDSIFPFVKKAIKLKKNRVIDALNLFLKEDGIINTFDFSEFEWYDVDTIDTYERIKSLDVEMT
ncbi:MAG: sugar phosphate nucleotidyltransferase [Candidatus Helarchaeota archaeon]